MSVKRKILGESRNPKQFLFGFCCALVVLLIVDLFIHKHGEFSWERAPGFLALYGFGSCVALIFIAKVLRVFIKRDEDYYG
ncbi:MAG: hypothetical protein JRH06_05870 [Deltaproteobacteria bacterium]|nr:hypothetical protein [Deltaproteobacteria bacterium]